MFYFIEGRNQMDGSRSHLWHERDSGGGGGGGNYGKKEAPHAAAAVGPATGYEVLIRKRTRNQTGRACYF